MVGHRLGGGAKSFMKPDLLQEQLLKANAIESWPPADKTRCRQPFSPPQIRQNLTNLLQSERGFRFKQSFVD